MMRIRWRCLLVFQIILNQIPLLIVAKSCFRMSCARCHCFAKATYRYRPPGTSCYALSRCNYHYQHLLLLSNFDNPDIRNILRDCTTSYIIQNVIDLEEQLSLIPFHRAFVIVHIGQHWNKIAYRSVFEIMSRHLRNISVYSENWIQHRDIERNCNMAGEKCVGLGNLFPIIKRVKSRNSVNHISSTLLDLYDTRWLPATMLVPDNTFEVSAIDSEIMQLASSLCMRNRRLNFYYEVISESTDKFLPRNFDINDEKEETMQERSLTLLDILPKNPMFYDKNRPPKVEGQPTVVYFHVTVLSLDSINEESMTYVADIFLAQSWRDQRLRLPQNMKEEYRILDVEWMHDIWKPDCFFKNAKQVTFHEISVPNHYLWLYHDKTLLYMSKLTLVLSCAMKFESYPHDTQVCSMMIESLSHTTDDLEFRWNATDPLVLNTEIELPQLDIAHNYTADCTIMYSTGKFTCLAVVLSLRRRLGYHLFHTYIPSALIVVMSWISFWIKPEAIPARVTLGVTSLLTLATQNTQSQQSLPPVSYVKAIDIWMSSCSIFVFLSLMEFAVVNNYMGPVATKIMKGYSDEDITKDTNSRNSNSVRSVLTNSPQYVTCCNGQSVAIYIDKFSRVFFPFSFIVLNIIYWTSFL